MATDVAVRAAGAVVWRPSDKHGVKVALIHRPRYDDWSLPKGKRIGHESDPRTAAREVAEETGFTVAIGRGLRTVTYRVPAGRKSVTYFAARHAAGSFSVNKEVDRLKWLPVPKARRMVSHGFDGEVLAEFARLRPDLRTVLLVRHAKAGHRESYVGDDRDRDLDAKGRKQAQDLVHLLQPFRPLRVVSAPVARCLQTVLPLATHCGLTVEREPLLDEDNYRNAPASARKAVARLGESVHGPDIGCVVAASQGGVIPGVVRALADRAGIAVPDTATPKGCYWSLFFDGHRLVQADRHPAP